VEEGETHTNAAIRELREELDVMINPKHIRAACFQSYPWYNRHLVRLLFTADVFSGKVKNKLDQKFLWVGLDELKNFHFMDADAVFAAWVIEHYKDER
jgi:ADP-ribose pyrophosphatase YjhB (NUDIX family)